MSSLLEIKDQVFPEENFHLAYHDQEIGFARHWHGRFYKVADESSLRIVKPEAKKPLISRIYQAIINDPIDPNIEIEQFDPQSESYGPVKSIATKVDIDTANRLFFAGAPTQAWLLMVTGLVRPKDLGITVADATVAILAKHR